MNFSVDIIIENKPGAKDPEGETIWRDLINRAGYSAVKSVRTGKYLRFLVEANDNQQARQVAFEVCNNLRIFNPVVHTCSVSLKES